ncbi:hypothetical protein [Amycolatopsis sp. NPDC051903]|uniref:hypothetical protein n=1 Tax=Amycolatopsis sp. NPDC051903 TaxID=3363936 RepID=UPI00379667C1
MEYTSTHDGLTVHVEKVGGGTLGRTYTGSWGYVVTDSASTELGRGQDFTTGTPKTHAETALLIAEHFRDAAA